MTKQTLETEIENATKRIETRQAEIDKELEQLVIQINNYTTLAWRFVWFGAFIAFISTIFYICKNTEYGFGLNLLGDFMAGTVASIWSLAGLFFIYVAFLGQKQQLLNQQMEIMYSQLEVKYTRLELSGQKEEMKEQNNTLRQQKFENTFFQLLSLFNSIVNSIDIRENNTKNIQQQGRDCFRIFYNNLLSQIEAVMRGKKIKGEIVLLKNSTKEQIVEGYDVFYNLHKSDLSHYFRTIYHIFKFIDESKIEDKRRYIAIARAQLSSYEQAVLFYNYIHSNGYDKFKPLIEKYTIFENIDTSLIVGVEVHKNLYLKTAFYKSDCS